MRLTLTGLSSQYIHMPLAPWCLRRAVETAVQGVAVTVCDLNVNQLMEELLRRIVETSPDVVGLSMYIWNRETAVKLIRRLKALQPSILVVVGGPEASYDAAEVMRETGCDYLLRGAGEESLPRLLMGLMTGGRLSEVPGLCRWASGTPVIAEPAPAPSPDPAVYDDAWQHALNGRMAYCETSRGCPFACAFCLSGVHEPLRFMPKEQALALLIRLGQLGTDTVKLIDRTFNCDRQRTKYLLMGLMAAKRDGRIGEVCYHFEVAADLFDDDTLSLLSDAPAGLFQMEAGLQSFHAPALAACHRHTDMALLKDRLTRLLQPNNIHLHIDLIAGLPTEDFDTFGRSFDCAFALRPHQLQLGFLKLIHGSRLRAEYEGCRFTPDPPYEVLSTPCLTYGELCRLHDCAEAVERLYNSSRFRDALALALSVTAMRPFALLLRLGEDMAFRPGRWSLDALTRRVWDTLTALGVPADALRDAMIVDRLSTDNTGYLPPFLQDEPDTHKRAAGQLRTAYPTRKHPRFAVSSDGKSILFAPWPSLHPVTHRGEVMTLAIESE